MKKILCPIDFSATSLNALNFAIYFANQLKTSELHIFTVQPPNNTVSGAYNDGVVDLVKDGNYERALEVFRKKAEENVGSSVSTKIVVVSSEEKPSKLIIEKAESEGFNLICMGTEGVNTLKKHILGSTTKNVLEHTKKHLLAIPSNAKFKEIEDIALGMDFQYFDRQSFDHTYQLAMNLGKKLHVFDVNIANNPLLQDQMKVLEKGISEYKNVDLHLIDALDVVSGIIEYTSKHPTDLLMVTTKNYTFVRRLFERSYTEKLIIHSKIPVLALKKA